LGIFAPKLTQLCAFGMHFAPSPGKSIAMANSKRSPSKPATKSTVAARARSGNPAVRASVKAATPGKPTNKTQGPAKPKPTRAKGPAIKPKLGHAHSLTTGDKAPPFTLTTSDGGRTSLTALRKNATRGIIIFFFTKAGSKTCTTEAIDFREAYPALKKAGFEVIGISPDNRADLAKFKADHKLPYPLASDSGSKVARKYGAYGKTHKYPITATMPDQFHAIVPKTEAPLRATFVLDADGHIEQVVPSVQAKGHVDRLRKRLKLG